MSSSEATTSRKMDSAVIATAADASDSADAATAPSSSWAFKKASELTNGVSLSGLIRYRLGLSDKSVDGNNHPANSEASGSDSPLASPVTEIADHDGTITTTSGSGTTSTTRRTASSTNHSSVKQMDGGVSNGHHNDNRRREEDQGDSDTDSQRSGVSGDYSLNDGVYTHVRDEMTHEIRDSEGPQGSESSQSSSRGSSGSSSGTSRGNSGTTEDIVMADDDVVVASTLSNTSTANNNNTPEDLASRSHRNPGMYDTLVARESEDLSDGLSGRGSAGTERFRSFMEAVENPRNSNGSASGSGTSSGSRPSLVSGSNSHSNSNSNSSPGSGSGSTSTSNAISNSNQLLEAAGASMRVASTSAGSAKTTALALPKKKYPFSIRMTPFVDHSSIMPSQYIGIVERKSREGSVIKIGRYSDRREADEKANSENSPIVFKSKVVSRSHAELFVKDGKWYIKDVKSSSGTFVNNLRLSPACEPSEPHVLNDGDLLQLGMDFRGGSEELYKCIKVRVELNKSWQKRANEFNTSSLEAVRQLYGSSTNNSTDNATADNTNNNNSSNDQTSSDGLQECAICLLPVSTCQALFVAPCSHGWHYKCIRPLVVKTYPHFLCPNCRSICDLEADLEAQESSDEEEDDDEEDDDEVNGQHGSADHTFH